jgi:hypothetical protein
MSHQSPPLRFILLVVGGWICLRTAAYIPEWRAGEVVAAPAVRDAARAAAPLTHPPASAMQPHGAPKAALLTSPSRTCGPHPRPTAWPATGETVGVAPSIRAEFAAAPPPRPTAEAPPGPFHAADRGLGLDAPRPERWSASAWALLRRNDAPGLAPGGTLGGSQAGLRIGYRLNGDRTRPLLLSARLYAPLGDRRGGEAAIGVEWRPVRGLPVQFVAERRQALGANGRSAFAIGANGGVTGLRLSGGLRLDAYGQAGVVGTRARAPYADGSARVSLAAGRLEIGAGAWGGAQPGAARLDAGPLVALRLPEARLRVSAEWRFRLAGDAAPGSGPALTIGSDF